MTSAETLSAVADASVDEEDLGKRERNKLDKQRCIVDAATNLFERQGFASTTTAEIASEAGIGAGTLYLYVGSKEDLLASVFEKVAGDAWTEAFHIVDRIAPLADQIDEVFLYVTEYHEKDPRLARSFFKELPWVDEPARETVERMMRSFHKGLEALLDDAVASGKLDPEVPTDTVGFNLCSLWIAHMRRRHSERTSLDKTLAEMSSSFRVALWGMAPET